MAEKKYTILLIEDEEMLANMYETKFQAAGYDIHKALDGDTGLKLAFEHDPDLILLDVIMPKLDGFSVLKQLRENPKTKNTPVLLLTNLGQDEDVSKGKKLGATGYLVKANMTPAEVVDKIKDYLKK